MGTKKVNFGIVGCGRIAKRHAEHIVFHGNLLAVCDVVPEKADALAKKYGVKPFYSIDDLLSEVDEIDVISICTPNGLHSEHSIKASRAGKHVLCEKPLAISVYEAGEMIKEAEKANKRLFAIKQNRFNPPVAAVKKAIDENRFGRIYSIQLSCFWNRNPDYYKDSWKGTLDKDGGTLFTQFSHFIDLLYWMFGDIKEVSGKMNNFAHKGIIEFEDTGVIIVEFYNGTLGTINYTVNSFGKNMEGTLTVFGEKGTVKIGGQYLNELEYQNIDGFKFGNLPGGNKANEYGHYQGSMSNHGEVYANLIDVLSNNGTIATNGFEGLKTVEIIDKIYSNSRNVH